MLKKIIETSDECAKQHIAEYVEKKGGIDELRGCITKEIFDDFMSYCIQHQIAKVGYHAFRRLIISMYDIEFKQAIGKDNVRYYVIK